MPGDGILFSVRSLRRSKDGLLRSARNDECGEWRCTDYSDSVALEILKHHQRVHVTRGGVKEGGRKVAEDGKTAALP